MTVHLSNSEASRITGAARDPVIIELPWPAKSLHPNARPHRMKKADATKKARGDACAVTKSAIRKCPIRAAALLLNVTFHPPSSRGDTDNMHSACKAYYDGIADAVGINDRNFDIRPVRGEPRPPHGSVRVEIVRKGEI